MSDPSLRASDPSLSAWVAANAGSGKTYTLANRVARLLLSGASPQRILCLTFTKAAAAEMQDRLFSQLGRWSMLPDRQLRDAIAGIGGETGDLPRARRLFAQALETPGGLKILTLHAFCQIVLARFPIEAGVPPGFTVLDDNSGRSLIHEARQDILAHAGAGHDAQLTDALDLLVGESGEETLSRILSAALGNDRRKLDRFLAGLGGQSLEDAVWRAHGVERGEDVATSFCGELKTDIAIFEQARDWLNSGSDTDAGNGAKLADFLAQDFSGESFLLLRDYLLKKDGEPRAKLATAALGKKRPDLLDYLVKLQERFCQAENRRRAARAAAMAEAALTLITAMRHAYDAAKKRRGALDYDDLIIKTLELLEQRHAAPWVLYKLDEGLDHILIDEAQDTSPEQWAIVRALTEEFFSREARGSKGKPRAPRTLFAVGDEKQSVFSFQGADPAQFDINRRHFEDALTRAQLPFAEQPLTTSRRSAPEILQFVDTLFASPSARAGLTSRGDVISHNAHRATAPGGVEFWEVLVPAEAAETDYYLPVDVAQKSSPVVQLAVRVADEIQGWIKNSLALPGHDEPIRPGDIMILLPRREPFGGEVIRQLKLRGIAVAGADRIQLAEQMAVMDLIALGQFVLQRDDELNLAALLRSPLCGLSEDDLFRLCHGRTTGLWEALATDRACADAHAFLTEMLARADYAPPFEFYSHALVRAGKRRALLARLGPEAQDAIEEFLSLSLSYEQGQTPSLQGFLDWIGRGGNEIKRDMERGRDEVRVMTVHGAKGLEADIVILPDTTGLPEMPWKKGHLLYADGGVLFPLSNDEAPEVVKNAKAQVEAEILNEHRRLLYVALTRARDRLYVCGFQNRIAPRDETWYRLAEAAAKELGTDVTRGDIKLRSFGHAGHQPRPRTAETVSTRTTEPWLTRPAPPGQGGPRLIRPSDAAEASEGPALSPLEGAKRFRRGQVAHLLLARLPELPPQNRRAAAIAFARQNDFGEDLADETLAVIDHPDFAGAFGPGSQAEVAFQAALPQFGPHAQVNGRIDRLAVTPDEVLILDYKTNRPAPAREEDVDPVYLAQMALYRDGAARIFPGRRIVCGLVWTDGPRLLRLSDALLDRQITGLARFFEENSPP